MKTKRILVTYLGNGNMESEVAKEVMFNRILSEIIDEGKEVESSVLQPRSKSVLFNDGSKLMLFPASGGLLGMRFTHVFADEAIKSIPIGKGLIDQLLKPSLMTGSYERFDTSGKQFNFFSFNNGELKIN